MRWREVRVWVPAFSMPRRVRLSTLLLLIALVAVVFAWRRDRQRLEAQLAVRNYSPRWGVVEATGPPDVPAYGDHRLAWASKSKDDQAEWLDLIYGDKVTPVAVVVHESYRPGALTRVTAIDAWGGETTLWQGVDPVPATAPGGVARLPVTPDEPINRIRIYLDSVNVSGWNEIDAVGLELADGTLRWAESATASSSYGPTIPSSKRALVDPRFNLGAWNLSR